LAIGLSGARKVELRLMSLLSRWIETWRRWNNFGENWRQPPVRCFQIENYRERRQALDAQGIDLMTVLETELPEIGALICRMNMVDGFVCVEMRKPTLTVDDVLAVFTRAGCEAHLAKEDM
jgi:hypothetical protein